MTPIGPGNPHRLTALARRAAILASALACLILAAPAAQAEDPPIATVSGMGGKVRVDILSLKRTEGETVTLRLALTNSGDQTFSMTLGNARLLDLPGRRIYSPGLTSSNCSVAVSKQTDCYAVFGAPPANLKTMTIKFYEQFELVTGVPISGP